jgi:hypothetical protein
VISPEQQYIQENVMLLLSAVELIRRFLWSIYRVEWEHIQITKRNALKAAKKKYERSKNSKETISEKSNGITLTPEKGVDGKEVDILIENLINVFEYEELEYCDVNFHYSQSTHLDNTVSHIGEDGVIISEVIIIDRKTSEDYSVSIDKENTLEYMNIEILVDTTINENVDEFIDV